MAQKLHTPNVAQDLLNLVMSWAESQLRERGQIPAAAATTLAATCVSTLLPAIDPSQPLADQEATLRRQVSADWKRGLVSAVALVAPVLYSKAGGGERATAVCLHIEAPGYCADILMPYRIRPASRWRGKAQNRVHFSHPVAQEAESWLSDTSSPGLPEGLRD